jgi:hypothetical protein
MPRLRGGFGPNIQPPVALSAGTVSGTLTVGQVLSIVGQSWGGHPGPNQFSYQWIRGASTTIPGSTGPTHTIVAGDQTNTVKRRTTATDSLGNSTTVDSAASGTIP